MSEHDIDRWFNLGVNEINAETEKSVAAVYALRRDKLSQLNEERHLCFSEEVVAKKEPHKSSFLDHEVIAIDFDGTLFESSEFPAFGKPRHDVIDAVKNAQRADARIILWTCRAGQEIPPALEACRDLGLHFDAINCNLVEVIRNNGSDHRKIYATMYVDDKAEGSISCFLGRYGSYIDLADDGEKLEEREEEFKATLLGMIKTSFNGIRERIDRSEEAALEVIKEEIDIFVKSRGI